MVNAGLDQAQKVGTEPLAHEPLYTNQNYTLHPCPLCSVDAMYPSVKVLAGLERQRYALCKIGASTAMSVKILRDFEDLLKLAQIRSVVARAARVHHAYLKGSHCDPAMS